MTAVLVKTAAVCVTMLFMVSLMRRGDVRKNIPALIGSCIGLVIPAGLFNIHQMLIWCILMLHSYTDVSEHTVFSMVTYAAVAGEVVYGIVIRSYAVQPLYMLIFPTVLIISLTKLLRGLADGDMEQFILVMLYAYNMGRRPEAYSVGYMTVAMIMFVLYTGAANAVRLVRHKETSRYGAFVPAMALSYLITECVVML